MSVQKTISPCKRVYSNKIGQRRRTLFPDSNPSDVDVDASPLSLSPERVSSSSLTEILKTPKDSNTHKKEAPKLSRKSVSETSEREDIMLSTNKTSKVRTTLFRDLEVSLSTKQFYSSTEPSFIKKNSPASLSQNRKINKPKIKIYERRKKKSFGQINAGVKHKIRRKRDKVLKISKPSISHIKTYKTDLVINSKFNDYFKDLEELNQIKKVKLIEHMPEREKSNAEQLTKSHSDNNIIDIENNHCKSNNSSPIYSDDTFGDDTVEDEISVPIDNIIDALEESVGEDKENQDRDEEEILSPSSQLSNMTLGLRLSSPKKVKNLTAVLQNMADMNSQEQLANNQQQFYPLFHPQKRGIEKTYGKECPIKKKRMKISSDQMLLDAGQKKFGLVECHECNFVYNAGDPNDEELHDNHHNAGTILHFNGWKNERIVLQNVGKIIQVLPGDSKQWIDKVKRLAEFINREMGYHDIEIDISRSMVLLYVCNKTITGCLMAESKALANKILTANIDVDLCSLEEYPVVCGVSRLWTSPSHRRKGIATLLMDTLRKNFLPDRIIGKCEIALSAPTAEGKIFATKYFETPNFYTYMD